MNIIYNIIKFLETLLFYETYYKIDTSLWKIV